MSSVITDTHTLVWYILEPEQLSTTALNALEDTTTDGEVIYLSAISIVEICYLTDKGRLSETVLSRVMGAIASGNSVLEVVPVDLEVSLAIQQIDRNTVPDMPDRIIAATALYLNLPLVTRDSKIQSSTIQTIW
ncbi:MAG: type II toxin-antitoxin system VapC family toxin [Synechococcales cyanobacterium C42_A2020_086]|jgi:PIN domain nuclease of toxin-antitoxin system|nr:type II toxin-antitoxin system VapC family toxin [Synechococcales cyanobacterium C42_A2020_086]